MNFNQKTYVFETKNICFFYSFSEKKFLLSAILPFIRPKTPEKQNNLIKKFLIKIYSIKFIVVILQY